MVPSEAAPLTIAVAGAGPDADNCARALRGVDGVEIIRLGPALDDALLEAVSDQRVDAVALSSAVPEMANAIKRTLLAGRHVFVAAPSPIGSRQLLTLDALARRRQRLLLFDTPALADERIAFIKKMTGGPHPLWRPRYLRSLRTGASTQSSLDEIAVADIATVLSIVGGAASRVSAFAPRLDDESGATGVAMLTLAFDGGPLARIDISLVEPWRRQEIAVVCDGRTVVLDALDARAPLQIQAATRHRGPDPGRWAETVSEHPIGEPQDRAALAASAFVAAARARDVTAGNAADLAVASAVWEKARESIALGGEMVDLVEQEAIVERPVLQLIRGGGHRVEATRPPELTLLRSS